MEAYDELGWGLMLFNQRCMRTHTLTLHSKLICHVPARNVNHTPPPACIHISHTRMHTPVG
jgi:hypothetical protein